MPHSLPLLLLLLAALAAAAGEAIVPPLSADLNDDVLGLVVFKSDVSDPTHALSSWSEDSPSPCSFRGVTCDPATARAVSLSLPDTSLAGRFSRGLLRLSTLATLDLSGNSLSGDVALVADLLSLPKLRIVDLSRNLLSGQMAADFFSRCKSLRSISLSKNGLSGEIPAGVASCASLVSLNFSGNRLTGMVPSALWKLPQLRILDLSGNLFFGRVPPGLEKGCLLRFLDLSDNRLDGSFPSDIGNATLLKELRIGGNRLSGSLPATMQGLVLCRVLNLSNNAFSGELPAWIGKMKALQVLDLSSNNFSGLIPSRIGSLRMLQGLRLSNNRFIGSLPDSIGGCKGLLELDVSWNELGGVLPQWLFGLQLARIVLSHNWFHGTIWIPDELNSAARIVDLSHNAICGTIPSEIANLQRVQVLSLASNLLSGSIPAEISELKSLHVVDLSANQLNGSIPSEISKCSDLASLNLSQNNLTGVIPTSMANLTSIQIINLSQNMLSGAIPKDLSALVHLKSFNISHNRLSGYLPANTFFDKIPTSSLMDNPGLCRSDINSSCSSVLAKPIVLNPNSSSAPASFQTADSAVHLRHKKILSISTLVAISGAAAIAIGVIIITVLNHRVRASATQSAIPLSLSDDYLSQSPENDATSGKLVMFSGGELEFSASGHAVLHKDCELGRGGFGAVYKAMLRDGQPVAIKKLTVSSMIKSRDDFEQVVKLLGKLRHPNLVELRGYYWTTSLQLLIYEFVPCGSLYKHLHEWHSESSLSWKERLDIALGIAKGLAHLHQHGVIHYNLKSSNVLLDGKGEPRVADYGLANLLPLLDRYVLSSKVQSALGYMAPEFACKTIKITDKCDVYGFGILLLEILTGHRPVEYLEDDVVLLCDVVRIAVEGERVGECIDPRLTGDFAMDEAVPAVKLAVVCTSQVPSNRPSMEEVVGMLEALCRSRPQGSPVEELM